MIYLNVASVNIFIIVIMGYKELRWAVLSKVHVSTSNDSVTKHLVYLLIISLKKTFSLGPYFYEIFQRTQY